MDSQSESSTVRVVQQRRMNTKLHAAIDAERRPIRFSMTAGHVSDCKNRVLSLEVLDPLINPGYHFGVKR
jgi:hypothetical protein